MSNNTQSILIGSDEIGLVLKNQLRDYLIEKNYAVIDLGVNTNEQVLYPQIAIALCEKLLREGYGRGVLVCGTGIGMAVTANKIPGIRAAVIHDPYSAERARASNDAQIATFGSLVIGVNAAKKNLDIWLGSEFAGGRSLPKVEMIKELDRRKE
ncbi:MAG TPA: ribose 5-phosphate isomerase B [Anaerolineaceae bacterium]|jgi:ribose 5-phosphate isomerase B|nr:ribose 5-phosphate isomerase B [Anaerolineaceae bacterium]